MGIRGRILLYLVLFVAFVILLLWLFQIVLLDSFYQKYKSRQVQTAAEAMLSSLDAGDEAESAQRLAAQYDVSILLLDGQQEPLVSAEGARNSLLHRVGSDTLARWCADAPEDGSAMTKRFHISTINTAQNAFSGEPAHEPAREPLNSQDLPEPPPGNAGAPQGSRADRSGSGRISRGFWNPNDAEGMSLLYLKRVALSDGSTGTLMLNAQITPVSATVSALRSQLLEITAIILAGALLLAWLISRRVSTPIIETNSAARELSRSRYQRPRSADSYREIAELNSTLEKAAADLGQVENLQHELIANISHDLRTPLTMIGGYAEAMRDIPDENTPENMQIIIDETARLSTLVNELLDFSRMQTGQVAMNPQPFDLTASIEATVGRIGSMVAKDGYRVLFQPEAPCWVLADEQRITQVVYNLVGNALTYTGEDRQVTVTLRASGALARVEVRDSGKGIAPEELPLIWNRYYRTKETHKRAVIGSGLGLNIVQSILERHSARYGVESRLGEGTVFWFELPLCGSAEEAEGRA